MGMNWLAKKSMLFVLVISVLLFSAVVQAETPLEQLRQMVQQLQQQPNNAALREKIIKLVQEVNPAPAIPEEAERRMARGMAAFKGAQSPSDYRDAVREFELATLAAPWYGDAYFNLGVAQDKAQLYEDALRSLRLAQLTSPASKEIRELIYEVEYRNEKAHSPEAEAARQAALQKEREASFFKSLDGATFVRNLPGSAGFGPTRATIRITGNQLTLTEVTINAGPGDERRGRYTGFTIVLGPAHFDLNDNIIDIADFRNLATDRTLGHVQFKVGPNGEYLVNLLENRGGDPNDQYLSAYTYRRQ